MDTQIIDAITACTNDRDTQNTKAMYNCIKSSISGDIKDNFFTQFKDLPNQDDGLSLFKKLTTFTAVSSLQFSILSFNNIINFNPINYCFNIPLINIKLVHLFVLATTATRRLLYSEYIQYILTFYGKFFSPRSGNNGYVLKFILLKKEK